MTPGAASANFHFDPHSLDADFFHRRVRPLSRNIIATV